MSNDIVGTQVGIYNILYECDYKTKCGHKVYHVQCAECGWESDMQKSDAKRVSECRHRAVLSQEQIDVWYEKNKKQCLHCGKDMPLNDLGFNEYRERKFCNNSCAASYINKQRAATKVKIEDTKQEKQKQYCQNCGKEIRCNQVFCSIQCQADFKQNNYITNWQSGLINGSSGKYGISKRIRRYLFEKYGNKCCRCGWGEINLSTGKIPLEIHHVDGDYTNNVESNLELLCPNCHSLTPTYKAANMGNGRKDRKKYYLN